MNVEVGTKVAEARRLLETDPEKGIEVLQQALKAVQAAEVSAAAKKTMVRRLEVAIELAKKDKGAFDRKMQDKTFRAEIEAKRLRILEADLAKQKQVEELFKKAKEAEALGNLMEAEQLAKRVPEIDPNNVSATALATVTRIKRHYERDKQIKADKEEGALTAFQDADAASVLDPIVQHNGIRFPKDFAELSKNRREMAAQNVARRTRATWPSSPSSTSGSR